MRHYELVLVFHPDQSDQVQAMIDRYIGIVTNDNGKIHRKEDWGRRQLAYPIEKVHKAHYYLLNIECSQKALDELAYTFKYNDAIIRHLILNVTHAITAESPQMKKDHKDHKENRSA